MPIIVVDFNCLFYLQHRICSLGKRWPNTSCDLDCAPQKWKLLQVYVPPYLGERGYGGAVQMYLCTYPSPASSPSLIACSGCGCGCERITLLPSTFALPILITPLHPPSILPSFLPSSSSVEVFTSSAA